MFDSNLDIARLTHDIAQLIADCIHRKSLLRTTWTRPMGEEQRRQHVVRRRLTERFMLLALTRKKLHTTGPDALEAHRLVAERLGPEYAGNAANVEVRA